MDPNQPIRSESEVIKDGSKEQPIKTSPLSEEPTPKKKLGEMNNLRFGKTFKKENSNDFISFLKENTKETIAYICLIAGMLMMFFDNVAMYGGCMVGIIIGLYFVEELTYLISNVNSLIEEQGLPRSLVFLAFLLIVLVKIPFLFIGIAIVAIFKTFFNIVEKKN